MEPSTLHNSSFGPGTEGFNNREPTSLTSMHSLGSVKISQKKLRNLIRSQLYDYTKTLQDIKEMVEQVNNSSLTTIDGSYIERKYIKYCSKFWLEETAAFVKDRSQVDDHTIFQDFFNQIDSIQNLSMVPPPWNDLDFYNLLVDHHRFIRDDDEMILIREWKNECLKEIISKGASIKNELEFITAYLDFLSTLKDYRYYIWELQLHSFFLDDLSFSNVLQKIISLEAQSYDDNFKAFAKTAKSLNLGNKFCLKKTFMQVIEEFEKPTSIKSQVIDGRTVVEVIGVSVVISEILKDLEEKISNNPEITEVRFIGGNVIHIDANLQQDVWHGKNIVIFAKFVKTHGKFSWDVSGKDNTHTYSDNAGVDEHGDGIKGADGFAGESGGNVLIQVEVMDKAEDLTIISHGGRGSNGQNGGNGKNGENGKGISKEIFTNYFPTVCKLNYITAISNLENTLQRTNFTIRKDQQDNSTILTRDVFMQGQTSEGFELVFSSYGTLQAFLLHRGSPGQKEGKGGEFGLGGQGGHSGEIVANAPIKMAEPRPIQDGDDGKGGLYGIPGENGWDMGYTDCKHWMNTEYFGINENCKLKLNHFTYNDSDHIWCPHYYSYITITPTRIENKKVAHYQKRQTLRSNYERRNQAEASKKKTISKTNVINNYSQYLTIGTDILQNCRTTLEAMEQRATVAMEELMKVNGQKQTMEARIRRHTRYNLNKRNQSTTILLMNEEQTKPNDISMDKEQCERPSGYLYLFEVLKKIGSQLPNFPKNDNIKLTPKDASDYLIRMKEENRGTSQNIPENTYEHNRNIFKSCHDHYSSNVVDINNAFMLGMKAFILEMKNSETNNISKYYNEYVDFSEHEKYSLRKSLQLFIKELSEPKHESVCALWLKSMDDGSLTIKVDKQIQKHSTLNKLYRNIISHFKRRYNWDIACKDKTVVQAFKHHVYRHGTQSYCYRELFAYFKNVNIRYYAEHRNQYHMISDHNPSSNQTIYLLNSDSGIVEMDIDKDYLELVEERKLRNSKYAQILTEIDIDAEVDPAKQQEIAHEYLINKTFLKFCKDTSSQQLVFDKYSSKEQEAIQKIIEYCPVEKGKVLLEKRLQKICSSYIGKNGILFYMMRKFSLEGMRVTIQELCYMVNCVLESVANGDDELNTFCWIIAAYDQNDWLGELLLMKLQNYFKKPLCEKIINWRRYLSEVKNKTVLLLFLLKLDPNRGVIISVDCIEEIFILLHNIPKVKLVYLQTLGLSEWPYALREQYLYHKLSSNTSLKDDQLSSAVYHLLCLGNTSGNMSTETFMNVLISKKIGTTDMIEILEKINDNKLKITQEDINLLTNSDVNDWLKSMEQIMDNRTDRNITQLIELIEFDDNISQDIRNKLHDIKDSVNTVNESNGKLVTILKENKVVNWTKNIYDYLRNQTQKTDEELLTAIDKVILQKKGFHLRDTQKLSILTFLKHDHKTLAQISTGEGKSLIIVAISIIKALRGERVDVITSSSVLAKRDAEIHKDIYNTFGINVGHNCDENMDKRKQAYSNNQVVYGDLSSFQRDYLLDKFYDKNILGDHKFENVIIDEVDSMLVDKGNNMLYLSHDIAGFDKLESVYIYIWQWMNRPAVSEAELSHAFDVEAIKHAILYELYGIVKRKDLKNVDSTLTDNQINLMWYSLIDSEILDSEGKLLVQDIQENDLHEHLPVELQEYTNRLYFLLDQHINRKKFIHVPNYLKSFIELHLESWIKSAKTALFMKEFQDYVVDVDRTGSSPDRNANITILDRDTGTDQASSQWDEALHQFLQLKHGCKLSLQSLKSIFISNVSFFKLYDRMYGLTGTLGSQRERDLLKEIHEVDFVTIPTSKAKQFRLKKPKHCFDEQEWIHAILEEIKRITIEEKRSILVVCETVKDVVTLEKAFKTKGIKNIHTYTRDYEEFNISKHMPQGQTIIATNLSGRGADIILTEGLSRAGGLHVCLAYLPNNSRIEEQAFGRAARCGEKGSGRLIAMTPYDSASNSTTMLELKKQRDADELKRLSEIKSYYETQIFTEEKYFKQFREQYERLNRLLTDKNQRIKNNLRRILLDSCLDKWAFWLDSNSASIKNITDNECKKRVEDSLEEQLSALKTLKIDDWSPWVEYSPIQTTKLGKYYSNNGEYTTAVELFNKVIEREPDFSEAAHYYKVFVFAQKDFSKENCHGEDIKLSCNKAYDLLLEHSHNCMIFTAVIERVKSTNRESVIQINSYSEQKNNICKLLSAFCQSIDDILGNPIDANTLLNPVINVELSKILYEDLLREGILKKPKVDGNICKENLRKISFNYGISHDILYEFLYSFQNQEINEIEFQEELENKLNLPSKEAFWKELIDQNVLVEEVQYVIVDCESSDRHFRSLVDLFNEESQICKTELGQQTNIPNRMFFDAERMITDNIIENKLILKESKFKNLIGEDRFELLRNKDIFTLNKEAKLNVDNCSSVTLSRHDSITLADFDNVKIARDHAELILNLLVEQNILEKCKIGGDAHKLISKYIRISDIVLPFCPAYEASVRSLLFVCFAYRIALQKLEEQLEQKQPFGVNFLSNPHKILYWELIEQKIIRPSTMSDNIQDLRKRLERMHSRLLDREGYIQLLITSDLIPSHVDFDGLFNHLVQQRWIIRDDLTGKYSMQSSAGRIPLREYQNYEQTIANIFENRAQLSLSTVNNYNTLIRLTTPSQTSQNMPTYKLIDLFEFLDNKLFGSEEAQLFSLNSLDQMIEFKESFTLTSTITTILMGICQIGVGVGLYRFTNYENVSTALIEEGINDIQFAFSSEDMSWENYIQYKMMSLTLTYARHTAGANNTALQLSEFGIRTATRIFEKVEERIVSSQRSVQNRNDIRDNIRRLITQAKDGLSYSSCYSGLDARMKTFLEFLCQDITEKISSEIENIVRARDIDDTISNCFVQLGEEKAKEVMLKLVGDGNKLRGFKITSNIIIEDVIGKIKKTLKKAMKSDQYGLKLQRLINGDILSNHIPKISDEIKKLLNDLKVDLSQLREEASKQQDNNSEKNEINSDWKSLFCEESQKLVKQYIVSPIHIQGGNTIARCFESIMKKDYNSYKLDEKAPLFEYLRQNYHNLHQTDDEQEQCGILVADVITNLYNGHLSKLADKTRNPILFSKIITENMPIDIAYVDLLIYIVSKMLNLKGLKIVAETEDGIKKEFSSEEKDDNTKSLVIYMSLLNGKIQIYGNPTRVNGGNPNLQCRNGLYEAISENEQITIAMTPEEFANKLARIIEEDESAQQKIKQIWHSRKQMFDAFGTIAASNSTANRISDVEKPVADLDDCGENNFRRIVAERLPQHLKTLPLENLETGNSNEETPQQDAILNSFEVLDINAQYF